MLVGVPPGAPAGGRAKKAGALHQDLRLQGQRLCFLPHRIPHAITFGGGEAGILPGGSGLGEEG